MTDLEPDDDAGPPALFGVSELRADARAGRAEAALHRALAAGEKDGTVGAADAALAAAALIAARALDNADRAGGVKGGYLVAQSLTGYRETLHALRLPTAIAPTPGVPLPAAGDGKGAQWLDDLGIAFGTPEPGSVGSAPLGDTPQS